MKKIITSFIFLAFILSGIYSCNKKDDYSSEALADYMNLAVGKYVRYRMDSTLFINFGQKDTVRKYQAKDVVEAAITDNLGRPGFRIVRYISDTNAVTPWTPIASFMVIPTRETIEVVENNFRFMKLKLPIADGYNWKGNSYISTQSSDPDWSYRFYDDWDYTYESLGESFSVWNNQLVENTITVQQRDDILGTPGDPASYSEYSFSKEVYGKGIGVIYKDFMHWEYQPPKGGDPGYKEGFGVKLVMIDHN